MSESPLSPTSAPASLDLDSGLPRGPLVQVEQVAAPSVVSSLRFLDVRWFLGQPGRGAEAYAAGHIPGAAFVDLDLALAAPAGQGPGRHPLPSLEAFASTLARLGIDPPTSVVAYDDAGGATAARLWWMLRWVGHERVWVLDGGLAAWRSAGLPLAPPDPECPPAAAAPLRALRPHLHWVVDKLEVQAALRRGALVLDARARERYEGKVEPMDARAGHIPGATSAPFVENLRSPGGAFRPLEELRTLYAQLGALEAPEVVASCGSGVTACHTLLALHLLGRTDARLYEGSWSDWASDSSLPAATGTEPGHLEAEA